MSSSIELDDGIGNVVGKITKVVKKAPARQTRQTVNHEVLLNLTVASFNIGREIGKDEAKKELQYKFQNKETNYVILIIVLLLLGFSCVLAFCYREWILLSRSRAKQRKDVEMSLMSQNENDTFLHEQELKYDSSYEIDHQNLEIGDYLAGGNFGYVYEGKLNTSQQWPSRHNREWFYGVFGGNRMLPVAIKTAGQASDEKDVKVRKELMEDELKLMCSVGSHPNVVTLIGAITLPSNSDGVKIIMEKCQLGSLNKYLISKRSNFVPQYEKSLNQTPLEDSQGYRLPNNRIRENDVILPVTYKFLEIKKLEAENSICTAHLLSFGMQIARGMEYLALNRCLHRDLAARNILLTSDGLCKIADFGLAKRIAYEQYYRAKRVQELPERWMAVECLNERRFTIESDIWSYAIVLYELFTLAVLPYPNIQHDDIPEQVMSGVRNDQPKYCPDEIYRHMTLCWDSDKTKRPSFKNSAQLMKKHLSQASRQVLEKVQTETQKEAKRQRKIELLRAQES